jgi:hypothetical protein
VASTTCSYEQQNTLPSKLSTWQSAKGSGHLYRHGYRVMLELLLLLLPAAAACVCAGTGARTGEQQAVQWRAARAVGSAGQECVGTVQQAASAACRGTTPYSCCA